MWHNCFLTALLLAGLTLILSGQSLPAQTHGTLRVHPENPRYFADNSGKAILLAGSHTWPNLVDMGPSDPPPAFDFDAHLKRLQQHGHNFTRGWTWEPIKWDNTRMKNPERRNGAHTVAPHPWPCTGSGLAPDGKPRFDPELTVTGGLLSVAWLHPVTGGSSTAETVAGGARPRFTAPAGEPVVLLLRNVSRS